MDTLLSRLTCASIGWVQGAAKSYPVEFFAAFSATAWNFDAKLYLFIQSSIIIHVRTGIKSI